MGCGKATDGTCLIVMYLAIKRWARAELMVEYRDMVWCRGGTGHASHV